MSNFSNLSLEELIAAKKEIEELIAQKNEKKHEIWELDYNKYKGSGKCWIAVIDPETRRIDSFLDAESVEKRNNYSGQKTFKIPLVEGRAYQFRESGSKSNDRNYYRIVRNGQLVEF